MKYHQFDLWRHNRSRAIDPVVLKVCSICSGECGSLRILDNFLTELVNGTFSRC